MTPPTETTSPLPTAPASQEPPPIWFLAPEGFFALPLAATPEERAELSQSFVRELYSRGDENIWEPAAPYYAAMAEMMTGTGVSYSAVGLFSTAGESEERDGETVRHEGADGVAQCALTVAAVPTDQDDADTDVVAQGILAILSGDEYNDARWLDLPCGPAVSCVTMREYKIRPELTETGEQVDLLTGQIQVHVPFPTGPFTAVFTLHTASMDYWAEFCDLMAAVLQTVSFTDPTESAEGAEKDQAR
ncbi:hypothetical protein [Streptomyces sp. IB201691-2A2]|uniref:hypothetical protein n=1 Tax=Streptomyces sp. IB201691-2A2 TaxID=2561920 RepID=UPI00117EE255|nr:hypothetical protein [Streptomyces sp. IB201691-2A2]TRO57788.1 hypothetical protein E4K73_41105 [Streptomyces sp. IB201691-2A2]